jgi:hypothetical protein
MKEKRKLRDRLALKMILPGDIHDHETIEGGKNDQGLFDLEKIKTKKVCFTFLFQNKNHHFLFFFSNYLKFHQLYLILISVLIMELSVIMMYM